MDRYLENIRKNIKSGILTKKEAMEYLAQKAESYDYRGLHRLADADWKRIKQL